MIPEFPNFKKIELSDQKEIESFTSKFPPYSDFNFTSLWSWDTHTNMQISILNKNLVIRFNDYLSDSFFYSFIGDNECTDTAIKLLYLAENEGIEKELKLIPEVVMEKLDKGILEITEDRDHFDYILDLELLTHYDHSKLRGHASFYRRLHEEHGQHLEARLLDITQHNDRGLVLSLTRLWMQHKTEEKKSFAPTLENALYKYFEQKNFDEKFISIGVFYKDKLVAFTINELEHDDYTVCHFMKADNSLKGIYSYLVQETSKVLIKKGKKYINFEQDLGLKNLRQSKKTFHPVDFLKKYKITKL